MLLLPSQSPVTSIFPEVALIRDHTKGGIGVIIFSFIGHRQPTQPTLEFERTHTHTHARATQQPTHEVDRTHAHARARLRQLPPSCTVLPFQCFNWMKKDGTYFFPRGHGEGTHSLSGQFKPVVVLHVHVIVQLERRNVFIERTDFAHKLTNCLGKKNTRRNLVCWPRCFP